MPTPFLTRIGLLSLPTIGMHRAELVELERLAPQPDPGLGEEHRSSQRDQHHDRDHQDHWRSDREQDDAQDAIQRRLHPFEIWPAGLMPGESRSVRVGVYRRLATASVHSPQLPFDCPMRPWPPTNTNTTDSGRATGISVLIYRVLGHSP